MIRPFNILPVIFISGMISLIALPVDGIGQSFFRISADFSIKEKKAGGQSGLSMGKVYYDRSVKQVVYAVTFPEKGKLVVRDSMIYAIEAGKLTSAARMPFSVDYSIFEVTLSGHLPDYGLEGSFYSISHVEQDESMVITTWLPDQAYSGVYGKVITSRNDKRLYGIVFYGPGGEMRSKQVFRNYSNIFGLEFPGEIVEITYTDEGENYKLTTYQNIKVDDLREDHLYHFSVPD